MATLFLSAAAAFGYGTILLVTSFGSMIRHPLQLGRNTGLFLIAGDVFLAGTLMLVAAIGLCELFVTASGAVTPRVHLPGRRMTAGLNELAARLVPLLVLIAVISFAAVMTGVQDGRHILVIGGGLALVIAALMVFLRFGAGGGPAASSRR